MARFVFILATCVLHLSLKTHSIEDPQGGRPPPHFYSRRFCRSVYRRTQSIRRSRNVKGKFAWGSYGGFLAESLQTLGRNSASSRRISANSRLNLGKFAAESRQILGGPKRFQKLAKGIQREAKRLPGCPKGLEKGAKRGPKAPQNHKKTSLYFETVFGCLRAANPNIVPLILAPFWIHFGSPNR